MYMRLTGLLVIAGCIALAQDDADIPPKFRNRITPEQYHQLLDQYLDLVRGLPADPSLREKAVQQLKTQQQRPPGIFGVASPAIWSSIGPSPIPNGQVTGALPVTGRVTAFEIDPSNPNKIYLGSAQGGVYRSLNGGTTWTQIFDGAASSAVGALALAPSNTTILYVGTGEANLSGDSYAGVGLYRIDNCDTTATLTGPINPFRSYNDGGNNPVSAAVFNGRAISSILVHPTDPSTVFVGVAGGVIGAGGEPPLGNTIPPLGMRGLVRLTNATGPAAGVVAQKVTVTLAASGFDTPNTGNRNVMSMVYEPGNPNIMTVWILGNAAPGDGGIYRSINAQAATPTFTQVLTTTTSGARGQLTIYKQGANPAVLYAATGESAASLNGRLRVSIDGGVTWSAFLAGGQGFCGGQCFYNIGLDVLPGPTTATTDDIIVLGGNTPGASSRLFAKSTDGGATFTESSAGLHADTHFIRIDPTNASTIYHGDDGGIFKSTDAGMTWSSMNFSPLNTVQFSGLAVHPTNATWSIGGTQDNGTNMRKSDGSWFRVDFGDGGYALVDRNAVDTTNMTLYHTYFNQTNTLIGFGRILSTACASDGLWAFKGIYGGVVSPTPNCDGSDTFNGIPLTDPVLFYAPMELGPGNPNTVYFGAGAVYRSANKGDTMPAVSQSAASPVSSIAVSPQDDNYRIFGRRDGTVFYTTTGANPMTALAGIPTGKFIGRVKFDPNNKNTAYVALGGYFGGTAPSQSHVWKVTNLNTVPVVTAINNGLLDVPVNAFAIDPADSNLLFAGTDIGVFGSTNGGATWTPYGSGLPIVAVFGAEVQATSRTLRVATHGRGMWEVGTAGAPPQATSVSPNSGSGASQVFSFVFTDPSGAADIATTYMLVNSSLSASNGCLVVLSRAANLLYLYNDAGTGLLPGTVTPGGAGTLSNSQCTLTSGGAVSMVGNNLTVPVNLMFQPGAFAGLKNIYGYATNVGGQSGGWSQLGTWTPAAPTAPVVVSVTPVGGSGSPQTFTSVYSDSNGLGDLSATYLLFNSSLSAATGCLALYVPSTNSLYLYNDAGTGVVAGSVHPGTPGTLSNSQCTIGNAGAASTSGGTTLTLPVLVTFLPAFTGTQYVFAYASSAVGPGSGWQTMGTWNPVSQAVRVVSVSPINGNGSPQTFTATYADTAGASDLNAAYLLFNSTLSAANGCLAVYVPSSNSLYLYNDAGNGIVSGSINPGTPGMLSNSQCTIGNAGVATTAGNNLSLPVAITFAGGFTGSKNVFGYASSTGGGTSGWETVGTWITH